MSNQNSDIENAFEGLERMEEEVEETEQDVEQEEQDLKSKEDQTEQAEKKEQQEIQEGEETGNINEIEDAEQKMERILRILEEEERETDDIAQKIENELKFEGEEINKVENLEGTVEEDFKKEARKLRKLSRNFQNIDDSGNRGFAERNFKAAEHTLQDLRYSAEVFRRTLEHEKHLINEIQETEAEEDSLEKLADRLLQELEIDKKEVKELLADSKKIQIPKDMERADMEKKELKDLLHHWNDEEGELERIDQELESELKELRNVMGEDEEILREMNSCIDLLEKLETIMQDKKRRLDFVSNDSTASSVLNDIDTTRNKLESILQQDENLLDKIEKQYSGLKNNLPSGPSARATAGNAARASITTGKIIAIGAVVIIVLGMIFASGSI